jgi:hypothetical protein
MDFSTGILSLNIYTSLCFAAFNDVMVAVVRKTVLDFRVICFTPQKWADGFIHVTNPRSLKN